MENPSNNGSKSTSATQSWGAARASEHQVNTHAGGSLVNQQWRNMFSSTTQSWWFFLLFFVHGSLGHTWRRKQGIRVDVLFREMASLLQDSTGKVFPHSKSSHLLPLLRFRFLHFSFEIPSIQTGTKPGGVVFQSRPLNFASPPSIA